MPDYPKRTKKPPAPDSFLQAAKEAALRQEEDLYVLDCFIIVKDERSVGASNKPVRDVTCGFKDADKKFVNFNLVLWEELALDTGPVLAEFADRKWCQVVVDLHSANDASWGTPPRLSVEIKTAWIILSDGVRIPIHAPMDGPYPPEEDGVFVPDDDDPFMPEEEDEDECHDSGDDLPDFDGEEE